MRNLILAVLVLAPVASFAANVSHSPCEEAVAISHERNVDADEANFAYANAQEVYGSELVQNKSAKLSDQNQLNAASYAKVMSVYEAAIAAVDEARCAYEAAVVACQ